MDFDSWNVANTLLSSPSSQTGARKGEPVVLTLNKRVTFIPPDKITRVPIDGFPTKIFIPLHRIPAVRTFIKTVSDTSSTAVESTLFEKGDTIVTINCGPEFYSPEYRKRTVYFFVQKRNRSIISPLLFAEALGDLEKCTDMSRMRISRREFQLINVLSLDADVAPNTDNVFFQVKVFPYSVPIAFQKGLCDVTQKERLQLHEAVLKRGKEEEEEESAGTDHGDNDSNKGIQGSSKSEDDTNTVGEDIIEEKMVSERDEDTLDDVNQNVTKDKENKNGNVIENNEIKEIEKEEEKEDTKDIRENEDTINNIAVINIDDDDDDNSMVIEDEANNNNNIENDNNIKDDEKDIIHKDDDKSIKNDEECKTIKLENGHDYKAIRASDIDFINDSQSDDNNENKDNDILESIDSINNNILKIEPENTAGGDSDNTEIKAKKDDEKQSTQDTSNTNGSTPENANDVIVLDSDDKDDEVNMAERDAPMAVDKKPSELVISHDTPSNPVPEQIFSVGIPGDNTSEKSNASTTQGTSDLSLIVIDETEEENAPEEINSNEVINENVNNENKEDVKDNKIEIENKENEVDDKENKIEIEEKEKEEKEVNDKENEIEIEEKEVDGNEIENEETEEKEKEVDDKENKIEIETKEKEDKEEEDDDDDNDDDNNDDNNNGEDLNMSQLPIEDNISSRTRQRLNKLKADTEQAISANTVKSAITPPEKRASPLPRKKRHRFGSKSRKRSMGQKLRFQNSAKKPAAPIPDTTVEMAVPDNLSPKPVTPVAMELSPLRENSSFSETSSPPMSPPAALNDVPSDPPFFDVPTTGSGPNGVTTLNDLLRSLSSQYSSVREVVERGSAPLAILVPQGLRTPEKMTEISKRLQNVICAMTMLSSPNLLHLLFDRNYSSGGDASGQSSRDITPPPLSPLTPSEPSSPVMEQQEQQQDNQNTRQDITLDSIPTLLQNKQAQFTSPQLFLPPPPLPPPSQFYFQQNGNPNNRVSPLQTPIFTDIPKTPLGNFLNSGQKYLQDIGKILDRKQEAIINAISNLHKLSSSPPSHRHHHHHHHHHHISPVQEPVHKQQQVLKQKQKKLKRPGIPTINIAPTSKKQNYTVANPGSVTSSCIVSNTTQHPSATPSATEERHLPSLDQVISLQAQPERAFPLMGDDVMQIEPTPTVTPPNAGFPRQQQALPFSYFPGFFTQLDQDPQTSTQQQQQQQQIQT